MKKSQAVLLFAGLVATTPVLAGFPEIPFCPLGGPPGWFNRLTGRDHPPPPPGWYGDYPAPQAAPAWPPHPADPRQSDPWRVPPRR